MSLRRRLLCCGDAAVEAARAQEDKARLEGELEQSRAELTAAREECDSLRVESDALRAEAAEATTKIELLETEMNDARDKDEARAAANHEQRLCEVQAQLAEKEAQLKAANERCTELSERMAIEQRLIVTAWYEVNLELQRAREELAIAGVGKTPPPVSALAAMRGKATGDAGTHIAA